MKHLPLFFSEKLFQTPKQEECKFLLTIPAPALSFSHWGGGEEGLLGSDLFWGL